MPEVEVYDLPSGGAFGYVPTEDPKAESDTHELVNSGDGPIVNSVVAGFHVTVDNTDPANPIVSATSGGQVNTVNSGTGISVNNTDPVNPVVNLIIPVSIVNGGTGQITQQAALDALAGAVANNQVLAGDGTHVTLRALLSADIPNLDAAKITSGLLALARGGTHANLSGTGGAHQVLRQSSAGADVTVSQLANTDISGLGTMSTQNANNVNITGGNISGVVIPDFNAIAQPCFPASATQFLVYDGSSFPYVTILPTGTKIWLLSAAVNFYGVVASTPASNAYSSTFSPATATASTDVIAQNSHGLVNGNVIIFTSIGTATGISINTPYYVINSAANSFKISTTSGGAAVDITADGTVVIDVGTLVTLIPNTDYALSRSNAITVPQFSYAAAPHGFPPFFNYQPTIVGYTATVPTTVSYTWATVGNQILVELAEGVNGTSNSTSLTYTTPVNASNAVNGQWAYTCAWVDNGTNGTVAGIARILANTNVINMFTSFGAAGWTASAGKRIRSAALIFPFG